MTFSAEILADSPLVWARHGEVAGTLVVADSSGNGRTGTYLANPPNNPTLGVPGLTGDGDTAADFNGTTNHARYTSAVWMDVPSITLESFLSPDTVPSSIQYLWSRDQGTFVGANKRCFHLAISATGKFQFIFWAADGGLQQTLTGTTTVVPGTKYQAVGTYNGANAYLFVNGVQEATLAVAGAINTGVGGDIFCGVGAPSVVGYFDGVLDDQMMYGTALSAARILAHWNASQPPPAPDAPTGLVITDVAVDSLTLDWDASAGATGYDVRIDGGAPTDVGNVLTHQFTGLAAGTSYTLEVRAYNGTGDSGWSSIVGETDAPPDPPTGLTVTDTLPTSIAVEWDAVVDATGYDVRLNGGAPIDVGTDLTYLFAGLSPGTSYTLEVRAYGSGGDSGWSSIVAATLSPPPAGYYRVELVVGSYSWDVTHGDPAAYGPTAGLWFGWEKPDDDPFGFAHPDHVQAGFGFIVADPADLEDMNEDDPVGIRVWFDTTTTDPELCDWSFYGRVTDVAATPHRLGMLYAVEAVSYTVDLAEVLSGLEFWPGNGLEFLEQRAARIVAAAGATITGTDLVDSGGVPTDRDANPAAAWSLLLELLKGSVVARAWGGAASEIPFLALLVLHTYATDTGRGRGDGTDFAVDYFDKYVHTEGAPLPAVFGELPSGDYGVTLIPDVTNAVIDADGVETTSVKWQRTKSDRPTRVRLEANIYPPGSAAYVWYAEHSAPLVLELAYPVDMAYDFYSGMLVADFLLPDPPAHAWAGDSYRFRLSDDPGGLPRMIPNHQDHSDALSEERAAMWVRPHVVAGIPSRHDPIGKGYVAGQLTGARLTITGGRVYVDFSLNRTIPPVQPVADGYAPAVRNYLSGDDLAAAPYDVVTWNDLDPELNGYDLRLTRETA